jgi:hypothetical protein
MFDSDTDFSSEADQMVTFVKRKLGDDVLSVELTKKQIWGNMEEASLEYSSILNQYQAKSQLVNFLGFATGSMSGAEEKYVRDNLAYLTRFAEPYADRITISIKSLKILQEIKYLIIQKENLRLLSFFTLIHKPLIDFLILHQQSTT